MCRGKAREERGGSTGVAEGQMFINQWAWYCPWPRCHNSTGAHAAALAHCRTAPESPAPSWLPARLQFDKRLRPGEGAEVAGAGPSGRREPPRMYAARDEGAAAAFMKQQSLAGERALPLGQRAAEAARQPTNAGVRCACQGGVHSVGQRAPGWVGYWCLFHLTICGRSEM